MFYKKVYHTNTNTIMSITVQPDIYVPGIDDNGNYTDNLPSHSIFTNGGIKCTCGTRKDKIYSTKTQFLAHIKTKTHKEWLCQLSKEHLNYYSNLKKAEEVIHSQKIIISRLEQNISKQDVIINILTEKISKLNNSVNCQDYNLIDLND